MNKEVPSKNLGKKLEKAAIKKGILYHKMKGKHPNWVFFPIRKVRKNEMHPV